MPKKAAAGGGGLYLGTEGWVTLGEQAGVVLMFRRQQMEDFVGDNGPAVQIATDVLVLSPTSRYGEFWPSQNVINAALTSKLVDEPNGTAVAARIAVGKRGVNRYPMANVPSDPEYKLVEDFYALKGVDIEAPDADHQLLKLLASEHTERMREQARDATGSVGTSKSTGSAPVDDDEPPF